MNYFKIIFFVLITYQAQSKSLSSQISLWQRDPCLPHDACQLPQPLGKPIKSTLDISPPTPPEKIAKSSKTYGLDSFSVTLELYITQKYDTKTVLITQVYLLDTTGNLIAQCTRYDDFDIISFFPVGSCSGIYNSKQVGVSFSRVL